MFTDGQDSCAWTNIVRLPMVDQSFSGQGMENIYIGIGAALYLVFVAWCIVSPHK
jgi:hypothetical protein